MKFTPTLADAAAFIHDETVYADVLHVFGEVDLRNADAFEAAIDGAIGPTLPLIADLESCRYIDSSGLRALIFAKRRYAERFLVVIPPGNSIRRVFDITRLTQELRVAETIEDAIAST